MIVPPVGPYTPVSPVSPVAPVERAKTKATEKTTKGGRALTSPARSATAMASHNTRTALDDIKLGG